MKFVREFIKVFWVLLLHLAPIVCFLAIVITLGGVLLAALEALPVGRGIYFAWITATTVGYGDLAPAAPLARVLCVALALVGLVNNSIIAAVALNAVLVSARDHLDLDSLESRLGSRIDRTTRDTNIDPGAPNPPKPF
jgi:voltage-gated potassium channel